MRDGKIRRGYFPYTRITQGRVSLVIEVDPSMGREPDQNGEEETTPCS